ncbi:MAG TPA: L-2-hydroxyglutarate oxidase [Verrucomicrobiae bacterium]|jgi:L-2-hydroxyglutarate oxidase LhgO|nr:L-2-hydroxyglutarate oxidase [Verrucomicrobiae bacterium]
MPYDFVIAGAGIVGLATTFELRKRHPGARLLVLEKEPEPGLHASGRNSGVLHSGIYYSPSTLKAKICREGQRRMIAFAREHGIAIRQDGKVIIASREQDIPVLHRLMGNAKAGGIKAELLSADDIMKIEPHCRPFQYGIHCPEVAVIDSRAVVHKLAELLTAQGVEIRYSEKITGVDEARKTLRTSKGKHDFSYFVNCGGAHADRIARFFGLGQDFVLVPFKGIYYHLRSDRDFLVRSNIYPVPDPEMPFLGVHFTRVIQGGVYAGPTAIPAFSRENYGLFQGIQPEEMAAIMGQLTKMMFGPDPIFRKLVRQELSNYIKSYFVARAQKLIPEVRSEDLELSAKVGIRPQLVNRKTQKLEMDYVLEKTACSLHVLNAISPAFTSAFAFAEEIVSRISK